MYKLALLQNRNGKDVRLKVLIQKPKNNFTLFLIYISQRNLAPNFELLYKRGLKKFMMINLMHVWDMFLTTKFQVKYGSSINRSRSK